MVSIESKEQVEVRAVFGYSAKVQFGHSNQQSQYLPSVPEFSERSLITNIKHSLETRKEFKLDIQEIIPIYNI